MIIFTPLKEIPLELLQAKRVSTLHVYNLNSFIEGPPKLNHLLPSIQYLPESVLDGSCDDPEFDIAFHRYILDNDDAFLELMAIVAPEFYEDNPLVQILVRDSPYRSAIMESIMKLIQQRYGTSSYYILTLEDFLYVDHQDPSIPGLFLADQDLDRWRALSGIYERTGYEE